MNPTHRQAVNRIIGLADALTESAWLPEGVPLVGEQIKKLAMSLLSDEGEQESGEAICPDCEGRGWIVRGCGTLEVCPAEGQGGCNGTGQAPDSGERTHLFQRIEGAMLDERLQALGMNWRAVCEFCGHELLAEKLTVISDMVLAESGNVCPQEQPESGACGGSGTGEGT